MKSIPKVISRYKNGNTSVTILSDGTKIREYTETPYTIHPESIDVKITDYCDMGCKWCHESSTTTGVHADLDGLLTVIDPLPAGVELAIGGGNPLSHPQILPFLNRLKDRGFIANLTVNQGHLKVNHDMICFLLKQDLIKGLGISILHNNFKWIDKLLPYSNNIVYHVIAGINPTETIKMLIDKPESKTLILGYKQFGMGVDYYNKSIETEIGKLRNSLPHMIGKSIISFDNLAIEQLNVKALLSPKQWETFYMGDDFQYTMYIDAVKKQYAPSSRSANRVAFDQSTLFDYYTNTKRVSF